MVEWHRTGKTICALIIYSNFLFPLCRLRNKYRFQNVCSELSSNVPISMNCLNPASTTSTIVPFEHDDGTLWIDRYPVKCYEAPEEEE